MFSSEYNKEELPPQPEPEPQPQPEPHNNDEILLNSFLIMKKRYRVLLHFDKIIWEKETRPAASSKKEVSVYDIISVSLSNGNKTPKTLIPNSTLSSINTNSTFQQQSSSINYSTTSSQYEFTNFAFQSADDIYSSSRRSTATVTPQTTEQLSTQPSSSSPTNQYLIINYAKRLKETRNDYNRWHIKTIQLFNTDTNIITKWHSVLIQLLAKQNRPKSLLMFINPYGGRQQSLKIYEKYCKPLFQLANIDVSCIISQRQNQIRDIIMQQSLEQYDGVCCVGGDGTFAEVFNGLIFRTIIDLNMNPVQPNFIPKPKLPIGIIPGGSTDTIVYCLHGTCDVVTATIHIILGQKRGLDLASVQNSMGLIRFYASVLSYGYLGDIALDSERFRWMGPKRYEYSGIKKFFANRGYHGEIKLLTSNFAQNQKKDSNYVNNCDKNDDQQQQTADNLSTKCYANCLRCSKSSTIINSITKNTKKHTAQKQQNKTINSINSNPNVTKHNHQQLTTENYNNIYTNTDGIQLDFNKNDESDEYYEDAQNNTDQARASTSSLTTSTVSLITEEDIANMDSKQQTIKTDCDMNSFRNSVIDVSTEFQTLTPTSITPSSALSASSASSSSSSPSSATAKHHQDDCNMWKNVKGKFFLICGANISCSCARSPNGLSQFSHLGDGFLDIILVRHTTFLNNIRLLLAMSNKNGDVSDLPFVEVYRTKKFLFRTQKLQSDNDFNNLNTGSTQPITIDKSTSSSTTSTDDNYKTSQWNCDGEVILDSDVLISSHCQLIDVYMRGPYPIDETLIAGSKCCGKF